MKIWSFTFGCKVNQYETELLRHRMMSKGDEQVAKAEEADVCLINTCSVTAFADKEARQMIRRTLRGNPLARVIVTGCYATRDPQVIKAISPRLEVYTNEEKKNLPSCVGFEVAETPLGIHQFAGRTRAFLKVQDGCQAPCTYCIIPTVRPTMESKPEEQVLAEAQSLLNNGYQELVLTGIRLGLYRGEDSQSHKVNLIGLLKKMVQLKGNFRIRLSSLEVTEVSKELIAFVQSEPKMCRHFHIPMQSGHSEVLKKMGRWYKADFYKNKIEEIRTLLPDCGLTADVMVGFPTETEEQFEETFRFIDNLSLSGLHVFRFSGRSGTKADQLKPLDPRTVSERAHRLGALDMTLRKRFYNRFKGTKRMVLPEPSGEGWSDNYIRVNVPDSHINSGLSHMTVSGTSNL